MHTTEHGNKYTNSEWAEMQGQLKSEAKAADAIDAKVSKMLVFLRRTCVEFGFSDKKAKLIADLFRDGSFVEADIQYGSKAKEIFLNDLYSRFDQAMSKLN